MDIPIDAEVECADGPCGRSTYILLRPATGEITDVVVRETREPNNELLVPVRFVTESAPDFLKLRLTSAELAKLQVFVRTEFLKVNVPRYSGDLFLMYPYMIPEPVTVTTRQEAIPEGELAVRRGAQVQATDGTVGQVDEFLVRPETDEITHLILREGHLWGQKEVAIPISKIDHFSQGIVFLTISKQEIGELPSIGMRRRPLALPMSVELRCSGEPCGYLTYYVLDPGTCRVTHIVARPAERSYLQYMVPVRLVVDTEPGLVDLSCEAEDLEEMEPFVETEYVREDLPIPDPVLAGQPFPAFAEREPGYSLEPIEVAVDRQRVPSGEVALPPGTQVRASDGPIGKMDCLMIEPHTGQITELALRRGHIWGEQDILIPASVIDLFAGDSIHLRVDKHWVSKLPGVAVQRRPK